MKAFVFKTSSAFIGKFDVAGTDEILGKLLIFGKSHTLPQIGFIECSGKTWTFTQTDGNITLKEGNFTSKSEDQQVSDSVTIDTLCHVIQSDQKKGPYVPQQIISMWDSGAITADALVLPSGHTEPVLITNFLASYKSQSLSTVDKTGFRGLGIAMIALGAVITLHFAVIYDTTVATESGYYDSGRVVNLGKQQNRLIGVLVGISLTVGGIIVVRQKKA